MPRGAAQPPAEKDQRHHDKRHHDKHDKRHFGARQHHHHQPADKQDHVSRRHRDGRGHHRLHDRRVGRQPCQHVAGPRALVPAGRERQQMREQRLADVGKNAFADLVDKRRAKIASGGEKKRDRRRAHHRPVEKCRILAPQPFIDKIGKTASHRQKRPGHHQQRHHRAGDARPVRPHIGPEHAPQRHCRIGPVDAGHVFGWGHAMLPV